MRAPNTITANQKRNEESRHVDLALHIRDRRCRLSQRCGDYDAASGPADPARIVPDAAIGVRAALRRFRPSVRPNQTFAWVSGRLPIGGRPIVLLPKLSSFSPFAPVG